MDITPQLLKDVKFSESWRGYDRDEVDEFLERVGAGVALVQGRLREANDRADAAEARAMALGNRSEAEETLKRTLVLAQRTADAAVAEANEAAARTVSEAEARASRMLSDAEAQAARTVSDAESHAAVLRTEAEAEVRRVIESTRAPLVEEIKELEQLRNFLRDDVGLLEGHLSAQRERLRAQLVDIQRMLDEPSMLKMEPTPETSGVDPGPLLPPTDEADLAGFTSTHPVAERSSGEHAVVTGPAGTTHDDEAASAESANHATPADEPAPRWADPASYELPKFESSFGNAAHDDAGPPTKPVQSLGELESGGDSFLDQLRRAVDNGPDDDTAMTAFFDQDDDDRPRSRFGRRR